MSSGDLRSVCLYLPPYSLRGPYTVPVNGPERTVEGVETWVEKERRWRYFLK